MNEAIFPASARNNRSWSMWGLGPTTNTSAGSMPAESVAGSIEAQQGQRRGHHERANFCLDSKVAKFTGSC